MRPNTSTKKDFKTGIGGSGLPWPLASSLVLYGEVERYRRFRKMVVGQNPATIDTESNQVDIKAYVKYVLKAGTNPEKRELLVNIKSQLKLNNKRLFLEKDK